MFCCQRIVFNAFGDGLVGAANAFAAVESTNRIVAAAVKGHVLVTQPGDVRREKARGADVEIHLIAVTIHRRAFAGPNGPIVSPVERVRRGFDSDKFGAPEYFWEYALCEVK